MLEIVQVVEWKKLLYSLLLKKLEISRRFELLQVGQVGEWKKLLCGLLVEILEISRRFVRVKKLLCSITTLMLSLCEKKLLKSIQPEKHYKSPYNLKNTIKVFGIIHPNLNNVLCPHFI